MDGWGRPAFADSRLKTFKTPWYWSTAEQIQAIDSGKRKTPLGNAAELGLSPCGAFAEPNELLPTFC